VTRENYRPCFLPGTLVDTEHGLVPIERVKAGTRVVARNGQEEPGLFKVADTVDGLTSEVVRISLPGGDVTATKGHPFMVRGRGWISARALARGDELVSKSGSPVAVQQVDRIRLAAPTVTCNLTVTEASTYFVWTGGCSVLVHNGNGKKAELPDFNRTLYWIFGKPRGRTTGPKIDKDGISLWRTDNRADVDLLMETRVKKEVPPRSLTDEMSFMTEQQLREGGLAHPETAPDPNTALAKTHLKHHSARPLTNPDPVNDLTLEEISLTEKKLTEIKRVKFTPKKLHGQC
jgi:hypothetical protein